MVGCKTQALFAYPCCSIMVPYGSVDVTVQI